MIVLITNKNNPKVKKVMGKVNTTNIGFTKKFKSANTIATFTDVSMPFTSVTPFIKWAISSTSNAEINSLRISFIC